MGAKFSKQNVSNFKEFKIFSLQVLVVKIYLCEILNFKDAK
jgi:hypothetical protein